MSLLAPLGLLGLLGIAVLIFIYLIKPNYQQKLISSTYVWKLSLKYKKRRVPVSRIRSILIFLCQMLILASFAIGLARPVIPFERVAPQNEKVVIIDASASMLVAGNNGTRFERAVTQAKELAEEALAQEDSAVSVIVADAEAYFLVPRASSSDLPEVREQLDSLVAPTLKCSYGSADLDGAAALAEEVLRANSETEVILLTATDYIDKGRYTVVDVSEEDDWNVAILNCKPVWEDGNCYSFPVEVGCYGRSKEVTVYCEIKGANGQTEPLRVSRVEYFNDVMPEKTVTFETSDFGGVPVATYTSVNIYVDEKDPFDQDNTFNVYGGEKPKIRVQYASSEANNFFAGVLRTLRTSKRDFWDIDIHELREGEIMATRGYDLYIYEHNMPDVLPKDGIVLLVNPNQAPEGSGLKLGDLIRVASDSTLASGVEHPITKNVDPGRITVSEYRRILSSDGYQELLYYHGDPVMLVKEEKNAKVAVLALNLKMSSLSVMMDFPIMIYNLFNYFIPSTLEQNAFEIGDTVVLNARGDSLTLDSAQSTDGKLVFDKLPGSIVVSRPGDYTVTQTDMSGNAVVEQFFVHIPNAESNITKHVESLPEIHTDTTMAEDNHDLLIYLAAAALVLMFVEWWLHSRENI